MNGDNQIETNTHQNSGGILALQWLTYAFWSWFSVSLVWLGGTVLDYYLNNNSNNDSDLSRELAYPLAAIIIMSIIAFMADMFYAKREPTKKVGVANIIMLLHVVPFVLAAVGALVVSVFAGIQMLLSDGSSSSVKYSILTILVALLMAVLMSLTAVRAFFGKRVVTRRIVLICFGILAIGFIVAGIAGPVVYTVTTKDDRLVEQALPQLSRDIRRYVSDNDKLPSSLKDVTYEDSSQTEQVQRMIDKKLVTYRPNVGSACVSVLYPGMTQGKKSSCILDDSADNQERFYYRLCTTYTRERNVKATKNYTDDYQSGVSYDSSSYYSSSVYSHPKGEVCYDLYATSGYDNIDIYGMK